MADSARFGLAAYPSARVNAIIRPVSAKVPYPSTLASHHHHHPVTQNHAPVEKRERLSGGKRDLATASATDSHNYVPDSRADPNTARPAKKQKITYQLPHQNMEEGHFYVVLGEDIDVSTQRFKILSLLGEGTFGKVVEAWDRKYKIHCAVKIVRNVPKYTRDAKVEIGFMERVKAADPEDKSCFTKIMRYFENDSKHVCIVMPKYGPCLLDFLQKYGPFNHRCLAEIIFHSAVTLDIFHSELRLMHTDLKPENLLLETNATSIDPATNRTMPQLPCKIRICDLGGTCDERHSRHSIVSTRHYRSPEVVLGLGWMFSTDMWSMGAIIYELATGKLLFDTHDDVEHLHMMEKALGRLPAEFHRNCLDDRKHYFTSSGSLRPTVEPRSLTRIARIKPVREVIADDLLCDLIVNCMTYDRSKRLNARQLSTHPYIQKYFPEASTLPTHPSNRGPLRPSPAL